MIGVTELLEAMRAVEIPPGQIGRWRVFHERPQTVTVDRQGHIVPAGHYVALLAQHEGRAISVMGDHPPELRRHLEFALRARGRILITGLGLGCCVRAALANPHVVSVDVVERDLSVVDLVWPYLPDDARLTLHVSDALEFVRDEAGGPGGHWDVAWHDLWSDPAAGEEVLQLTHMRLMRALSGRVGWQGAWHTPRWARRLVQIAMPGANAWSPAWRTNHRWLLARARDAERWHRGSIARVRLELAEIRERDRKTARRSRSVRIRRPR